FFGFGGAGIGIAQLMWSLMRDAGLSDREAYARFYAMGRHGLLIEGGQGVRPEQASFARPSADVAGWGAPDHKEIGLLDVVRNAKPTALIGVSSQAGAFTEEVVRTMAKYCERPIIFPLSN